MRRKMLIAGAAFVLACTAAFAVAYVWRDPVNPETSARIRQGMTYEGACQLIGRVCDDDNIFPHRDGTGSITRKYWRGPAGTLIVDLDEAAVVQAVHFVDREDTLLRQIRRKLGLEPEPMPIVIY
jgi:hypothetical protein